MNEYYANLSAFLKKLKKPLFFSLFLQISSVLLNTSFSLMGFDISETIRSYFNFQFAFVFLSASLKIFFIYFIFFSFLQLLFERLLLKFRLPERFSYVIFSFYVFVFFLESVGRYPQMYSDFFYGKHSYLKFLLHLTTDYLSPDILKIMILLMLVLPVFVQIYHSLKNPEFRNLSFSIFSLFLMYSHFEGLFFGAAGVFLFFAVLQGFSFQIQRMYTVLLLSGAVLIINIAYYFSSIRTLPPSGNNEYSLILISADSLRKDRIGQKRNGESITPNIDRFANEAFQFTDHHTTVPRTFASWADLLTGQYSMRHKVRDMFPSPSEAANIGSADFPVIGQKLSEKGFATAVFSSFAGDIFPRADFGFQTVHTADFNAKILVVQKTLEAQIFLLPIISGTVLGGEYFEEIRAFASRGDGAQYERAVDRFIHRNSKKPFFLTVFSSVTHFPYSPPYPYYKKYADPEYYGKYKYFKFVDPTASEKPNEKEIQQIHDIFDSSVNAFDSEFGRIIDTLKSEGVYEKSVIVLTADHGESLYEDVHGHGHGEHLRGESVTSIPLFIRFPEKTVQERLKTECSGECRKFQDVTSSVDLYPTVMNLYGIEMTGSYPGKSLLNVLGKRDWPEKREVYSETGVWFSDVGDHFFQKQRIMYPNILALHRIVPEENYRIMIMEKEHRNTIAFSKHRALIGKDYKLIYIPSHDGVVFELYDRHKDPLNTKNIYPSVPAEELKRKLYKISEEFENAKIVEGYIFPERL